MWCSAEEAAEREGAEIEKKEAQMKTINRALLTSTICVLKLLC